MATVQKVYKIQESFGSVNNIETRREWIYRVNILDHLKSYSSYAIYYSVRGEEPYLAMVYVDINDKMVPRVTKPSPEEHYDNWMYAMALEGFAFKIEELFDKENIKYQKFFDVKDEENIYTIGIESLN